ncbi:MAG: adenine nucleotide alpha hydrolase [Endozoicomonas sp.]
MVQAKRLKLEAILKEMGSCSVAVSGGVDSMTLAGVAHKVLGEKATMVHAVSAAVPTEATLRVRRYAAQEGWKLKEISAGEMSNPEYKSNPVDRCYHCKSCLYTSIARLEAGVIVSGTNTDDLSDYRPGLVAAKEQSVRHPYVEAEISKAELRQIAKELDFDDLADLPASPCLSSRVETGIPIQIVDLEQVEAIEVKVRSQIDTENARCRVRPEGLEIQIDESTLSDMSESQQGSLLSSVQSLSAKNISLSAYRKGSAFMVQN